MSEPTMPKVYDPQQTEEVLYAWWEESGFFQPDSRSPVAGLTLRGACS